MLKKLSTIVYCPYYYIGSYAISLGHVGNIIVLIPIKATTRLTIIHLFYNTNEQIGRRVSKDIEIQKKTYTIVHIKFCNVLIFNF